MIFGKILPMVAIGKPRMTKSDRWKLRKCVTDYRAWCDELRFRLGKVPEGCYRLDWRAYLPIPSSWSPRKKEAMLGTLHQQKPDRDNIDKAICDALFQKDEIIAEGSQVKRWDDGKGPRIEIVIHYSMPGKEESGTARAGDSALSPARL